MLRACDVPKCPTRNTHRSLHYLPTKETFKNLWIDALRLNKTTIKSSFRVCSSHFTVNDFLPSVSDRVFLKKRAVPSQNLPKSSIITRVPATRKPPKNRHTIVGGNINCCISEQNDNSNELQHASLHTSVEETTNETSVSMEDDANNIEDVTNAITDLIANLEIINDDDPEDELTLDENANFEAVEKITLKMYADQCIQANTLDDFKFSDPGFMGMLKTDGDLNSFTGLRDFDLLNRIVFCMESVKSIQPELEKLQIPLDVAIVLVFTRIKTNLSFKQCGVLFKLHPQSVSKIFSNILPLLRAVLSVAVFWPTKELNSKNIPKCFKPHFTNTRAICDCTETEIQKLKSLTSRIKCYSHYKGKHTLKFQITINPFGVMLRHVKTC